MHTHTHIPLRPQAYSLDLTYRVLYTSTVVRMNKTKTVNFQSLRVPIVVIVLLVIMGVSFSCLYFCALSFIMRYGINPVHGQPAEREQAHGQHVEGEVPRLLFDYPMSVTDYSARFSDGYRENYDYSHYAKNGILVIPLYYENHVYRTQQIPQEATLGKPVIIQPTTEKTFGEVIKEIEPRMLEAEMFIFFVQNCPPVTVGTYFPAHCEKEKGTDKVVQLLCVYPIPELESKRLNAEIYRTLSRNTTIILRDGEYTARYEEAIASNHFLFFQQIGWPKDCVEQVCRNIGYEPRYVDYVCPTMFSWNLSGHANRVIIKYTAEELHIIKKFLQVAED